MARLLLIKAARRMRREGWFASTLWLGLSIDGDDIAILRALTTLWADAAATLPRRTRIYRVSVTLGDLTPAGNGKPTCLPGATTCCASAPRRPPGLWTRSMRATAGRWFRSGHGPSASRIMSVAKSRLRASPARRNCNDRTGRPRGRQAPPGTPRPAGAFVGGLA